MSEEEHEAELDLVAQMPQQHALEEEELNRVHDARTELDKKISVLKKEPEQRNKETTDRQIKKACQPQDATSCAHVHMKKIADVR